MKDIKFIQVQDVESTDNGWLCLASTALMESHIPFNGLRDNLGVDVYDIWPSVDAIKNNYTSADYRFTELTPKEARKLFPFS